MKTLKYKKFKGLRILCKKCGYEIQNISEDGLNTTCEHPISSQIYKAVLIDPFSGKKKTRNLISLNYDEAVKELLEFKKELSNPIPNMLLKQNVEEKPMGLKKCIVMYLDYLNGEGVLEFEKRERNKTYLSNMRLYCTYFVNFLKTLEIDVESIRVDEVTDKIVEAYYKYVLIKTKSNCTYNDTFKPLKGLYRFLIDKRDYLIRNPFKNIPHKDESSDPRAMELDDVFKIINAITPEDSVQIYSSGAMKNRYKDWLVDAIYLSLYTGVRNEQLVMFKWSDIQLNRLGEPEVIKSNNLKVNRIQNRNKTKKDKFVSVPISDELYKLLLRLGLEENKSKDRYIIASNELCSRITIMKQLSAGFSFFRNKAGVDKELSFTNLRKTYITALEFILGKGNVKEKTGHSKDAVLENHYIDKTENAKRTTRLKFRLYDEEKV